MKKTIEEFKKFILRGNVVDMAVGVIVGSAFGKIVTSLVNDILMPPIGLLLGSVNFTDLKVVLKEGTTDAAGAEVAPVSINYGAFIQYILDFLLVALCIFSFVKAVGAIRARFERKKEEEEKAEEPKGPTQEELLTEIRDLLREQQK